jgi:Domain of unknown function (DUF4288)
MVEPVGGETLNDCIYLFRAVDFAAAFLRAITLGELAQKECRNAEGRRVLWRFKEVISLDIIRTNDLDGAEIYSEPIHLKKEETIPFETQFRPSRSNPLQTI